MNDKLKQMAEQAGFIGESMNPIFGTCQETALKNFAELIIRECADWIDRQDESRCPYGLDLLEHFGIE